MTDDTYVPWALSLTKWCKARGISRAHHHAMRKLGLTPKEIRMGKRIIITEAADAEWQVRMQEIAQR